MITPSARCMPVAPRRDRRVPRPTGLVLMAVCLAAGCDKQFGLLELEPHVPPDAPFPGTFCEWPPQADATFCADFDASDADRFPGFIKVDAADPGSRYELETAEPHTPPGAARLSITCCDARLNRTLSSDTKVDLRAWLRLSTAEPAGATVNILTYATGARGDQQLHALTIVSSGTVLGHYYRQASNDFGYPVSSPLGELPRDSWFELELHLDLAAAPNTSAGSIVVDGRSTDVQFDRPFVTGTYGLLIGPHDVKNGTNAGWTTLVDEVVVRTAP